MPIITKIYIWSILFEPLLFFVLTTNNNFIGIPLSVSRILQIIVLLLIGLSLIFKIIDNKKLFIVNNLFPENQFLILFFVMSVFAGFVGIIYGSYNLPFTNNSVDFNLENINYSRSIFEYFILIFNIIYFALLPRHLIKTKNDFDYFFLVFKYILFLSIFFGYLDYLLYKLDIIDLIGRHIRDGIGVGDRFHGFGGEPRQAVVHIIFNLSMYILYCKYFDIKSSRWIMFLLILSLPLTTSMSLFIALIFFIFFLVIFRLLDFKIIVVVLPIFLFLLFIDRIGIYIDTLNTAWKIIDSGSDLPYHLHIIRGEVFPIYDLSQKLQNLELIPVLFGNGLGSVSIINNIYIGEYVGTKNPNAQIIRLLFESGILGTIIFVAAIVWPIKYHTKNYEKKNKNFYLISTLLVLSTVFAIRSPVVFIYLGILTAFLKLNEKKIKH